ATATRAARRATRSTSSPSRAGAPTAPSTPTPTRLRPPRRRPPSTPSSSSRRATRAAERGSHLGGPVLAGQRRELVGDGGGGREDSVGPEPVVGRDAARRARGAHQRARLLRDQRGGGPVPPVEAVLEVGVGPAGGDRAQVERGGT